MGPFVNIIGTITPLTGFEEKGITYLAATNAGWLPHLVDEGIRFVHYPANKVRRQFGLDQDIPDDLSSLMESPTSIRPFLRHVAFKFWSKHFIAITISGSQREGICTPTMHKYWQAVMTTFEQELMGSHGFSLIPPNGLSTVILTNPRLLLPSKSVLAYTRKQSWSAIFEWVEKDRGWLWHANDYPISWEKKVKVINIPMPGKKGYAKPKSTKKGGDSSKACSDVVPFESSLLPIGNIVLEGSPPPSAHTRSSIRPTASKSRFVALRLPTDAPPSSRTRGSKRKTSPPHVSTTIEQRVCYL